MPKPAPTILVVEDEVIVAMDLAMTLEESGFDVLGPFYDVKSALIGLETAEPDAALLDVNLGQSTSDEIANIISSKGCPFAFITGYNASGSTTLERFPEAVCMPKPVNMKDVVSWLKGLEVGPSRSFNHRAATNAPNPKD